MDVINYSMQYFYTDMQLLGAQIKHCSAEYEYIVGLARGGLIPATVLSHKLNLPLEVLKWQTRDGERVPDLKIAEDIKAGKRILIVDDLIDSGTTIRELLNEWGVERDQVDIAVIYYNPKQETKPDFFTRIIDRSIDERWIVFWWENHV